MASMNKLAPFLWFNDNAEEAAEFYLSVFSHARKLALSYGGLLQDIGISFMVPTFFICLVFANIRIASRSRYNGLKLRLSLLFAIALFGYSICNLMYQDRYMLLSFWQQNRLLATLIYVGSCCATLLGIIALINWKLRPTMWKTNRY